MAHWNYIKGNTMNRRKGEWMNLNAQYNWLLRRTFSQTSCEIPPTIRSRQGWQKFPVIMWRGKKSQYQGSICLIYVIYMPLKVIARTLTVTWLLVWGFQELLISQDFTRHSLEFTHGTMEKTWEQYAVLARVRSEKKGQTSLSDKIPQ